jgi:hypothetical protein
MFQLLLQSLHRPELGQLRNITTYYDGGRRNARQQAAVVLDSGRVISSLQVRRELLAACLQVSR